MHDCNGTPLKKGDKVLIPAVVVECSEFDEYCNLSVETTLGRRPDGRKSTRLDQRRRRVESRLRAALALTSSSCILRPCPHRFWSCRRARKRVRGRPGPELDRHERYERRTPGSVLR